MAVSLSCPIVCKVNIVRLKVVSSDEEWSKSIKAKIAFSLPFPISPKLIAAC